eukprot:TRINITY_DN41897_c0_g1_i1.p1 TRINITY_DN41897_c0_g1~~TRINITY_DN41897_c0_g1_i1.p1  ORF type:complete len:418 (-),score=54.84 TRINITY_DN41897_c0_g1_i1:33-1286(-)
MTSRAPLLPSKSDARQGTPISSALNLAAAAVGSGILTLPFAFACSGPLRGVAMVLFLGAISATTLVFLVKVGRATKLYTFEQNATYFFGEAGGRCFNALFTLLLFMIYMAYARTAVDLLPVFLKDQFGSCWLFEELPVGLVCVTGAYFVVVLSRSLHALRYTSALALCCLMYFVILLLLRGLTANLPAEARSHPVHLAAEVHLRPRPWLAPPLFMSSLLCHFNMYDVELEMRTEHRGSIEVLCYAVILAIALLYILVGMVGWSLFGDGVSDDVLKDFGADGAVQLARFLLGLTNAFRIPLIIGPLHRSARHLFCAGASLERAPGTRHEHALEVAVIMFGGFYVCIQLPLGKVLGLIGCTCGALTCVSFPAGMYLCCLRLEGATAGHRFLGLKQASAAIVLIVSLLIIVTGIAANVSG